MRSFSGVSNNPICSCQHSARTLPDCIKCAVNSTSKSVYTLLALGEQPLCILLSISTKGAYTMPDVAYTSPYLSRESM